MNSTNFQWNETKTEKVSSINQYEKYFTLKDDPRNCITPRNSCEIRDMFFSTQINIEALHLYFYVVIIQKHTLKSRYTRTMSEMIDDRRVFNTRLLLWEHNAGGWERGDGKKMRKDFIKRFRCCDCLGKINIKIDCFFHRESDQLQF